MKRRPGSWKWVEDRPRLGWDAEDWGGSPLSEPKPEAKPKTPEMKIEEAVKLLLRHPLRVNIPTMDEGRITVDVQAIEIVGRRIYIEAGKI